MLLEPGPTTSVSRVLYCVGWELQATGGGKSRILLLISLSIVLAAPQHHNLLVHMDGHHAELLESLNQSSGLCHTSCLQLGHNVLSRPTAGWLC